MQTKETATQKLQVRFTPTMYARLKESAQKNELPLNTEIKRLLELALTIEEDGIDKRICLLESDIEDLKNQHQMLIRLLNTKL